MSTEIASELSSFHRFIAERLDQGETDLSPEQALDIWRASHSSPAEYDETVAALR
ncbi:MAG TPA: hypothetical protein VND64_16585 [Pirellulales bacterium]|nr:hypothetical protein [Pirellulales bacterium]